MSKSKIFWQQYGPYLALGVALTAMLGSLYYSEIAATQATPTTTTTASWTATTRARPIPPMRARAW